MVSSGDNNANIVYIKQANQQQSTGMEIGTGLSSGEEKEHLEVGSCRGQRTKAAEGAKAKGDV